MLIFDKVVLSDADFHHDLLLKAYSNLLDLGHSLCDHSEILVHILVSLLAVVAFPVIFEVFREFEDFLF